MQSETTTTATSDQAVVITLGDGCLQVECRGTMKDIGMIREWYTHHKASCITEAFGRCICIFGRTDAGTMSA